MVIDCPWGDGGGENRRGNTEMSFCHSLLPQKKFYAPFFVNCVTKCLWHSIQNWLQVHCCRVVQPPISCNSRVASNYAVTLPGRQQTEGHDINCKKLLLQSVPLLKGLLAPQGHRSYLRVESIFLSPEPALYQLMSFLYIHSQCYDCHWPAM